MWKPLFLVLMVGFSTPSYSTPSFNPNVCPNSVFTDLSSLIATTLAAKTYTTPVVGLTASVARQDPFTGLYAVIGQGAVGTRDYTHRTDPAYNLLASDAGRIGSNTKAFTATICMMLNQKGVLDLKAPLPTFFGPKYKMNPVFTKGTVQNVLNHEGGIIRDFDPPVPGQSLSGDRQSFAEQLLSDVNSQNAIAAPGLMFSYSNAGYILLSYIIELVTGKVYEDVVQSHIFDPLNLPGAFYEVGFWEYPAGFTDGYAYGHQAKLAGKIPSSLTGGYDVYWGKTKHYMSSAGDIHMPTWAHATWLAWHQQGINNAPDFCSQPWVAPCLDKAHFALLHTPGPAAGNTYAMGWFAMNNGVLGGSFLYHNGVIQGWYSESYIVPFFNVSVSIISNTWGTDPTTGEQIYPSQATYDVAVALATAFPLLICGNAPNLLYLQFTHSGACTHTTTPWSNVACKAITNSPNLGMEYAPAVFDKTTGFQGCGTACVQDILCNAWTFYLDSYTCVLFKYNQPRIRRLLNGVLPGQDEQRPDQQDNGAADSSLLMGSPRRLRGLNLFPTQSCSGSVPHVVSGEVYRVTSTLYTGKGFDSSVKPYNDDPSTPGGAASCPISQHDCESACMARQADAPGDPPACTAWVWNQSTHKCFLYSDPGVSSALIDYPLGPQCAVVSGIITSC